MQKVDFYALTSSPLPERLRGADSGHSIRLLSPKERLQIEDQFFKGGIKLILDQGATAVVVSQVFTDQNELEECATLVEFALALLTVSGFQAVQVAATFAASSTQVLQRPSAVNLLAPPAFPKALKGAATAGWLRRFLQARGNTLDRMHITADRFVRYSRAQNPSDSLMDLCISLESLLESQTEVSFRFGTCLAKVTGDRGRKAEEIAKLLSDLYDLRSKIAHGDPAALRSLEKIRPQLPMLRKIARTILINYVLFMSEHSRPDWKQHLHTLLFA